MYWLFGTLGLYVLSVSIVFYFWLIQLMDRLDHLEQEHRFEHRATRPIRVKKE